MSDPREGSGPPGLPDFRGGGAPGGHRTDPGSLPQPPLRPRRAPLLLGLLGAGVLGIAALAVVALVLWQTLLRPDPAEPTAAGTTSAQEEEAEGEYVPATPQESPEEGPATTIEEPTTECTVLENASRTEQTAGALRGGGLEIELPDSWETSPGWGTQFPYTGDLAVAEQAVEGGWYSLVAVGTVEFSEEEGGYPGAEAAARALLECSTSREQVRSIYGSPAQLEDVVDEAITVDGHEGWRLSARVLLDDLALLHTTESWERVIIVLDTPEGPAVLDGGAASGHERQVADLAAMVESLRVL